MEGSLVNVRRFSPEKNTCALLNPIFWQATEAIPAWAAEEGYEVTNFEQIDDAKWSITVIK